jgi:hypothetical protein
LSFQNFYHNEAEVPHRRVCRRQLDEGGGSTAVLSSRRTRRTSCVPLLLLAKQVFELCRWGWGCRGQGVTLVHVRLFCWLRVPLPRLRGSPFCLSVVRQVGPLGGEGTGRHVGVISGTACHADHAENGVQVGPFLLDERVKEIKHQADCCAKIWPVKKH